MSFHLTTYVLWLEYYIGSLILLLASNLSCSITNIIVSTLIRWCCYIICPITGAPQFDSKQSRISAKRGSSAVLECKVKGDSPMTFHWFKDGQPVDLGRHARYAQTMTDRLGNFSLSQVTVSSVERSDNAVFTCQASNDYGTDSTSVRLIVQGKLDWFWDYRIRTIKGD